MSSTAFLRNGFAPLGCQLLFLLKFVALRYVKSRSGVPVCLRCGNCHSMNRIKKRTASDCEQQSTAKHNIESILQATANSSNREQQRPRTSTANSKRPLGTGESDQWTQSAESVNRINAAIQKPNISSTAAAQQQHRSSTGAAQQQHRASFRCQG